MKFTHGVKAALLTASLSAASLPISAFAENLDTQSTDQQSLEKRYYLRDYQTITKVLSALNRPLNTDEQLLLVAIQVQLDEDDADDALEDLVKANPNNAKIHYWAGKLWQIVAQNSSMFSRMSVYSRYVEAMITAAKLEPSNARYQMEAAKAYGQPSIMGGDSDQQAPIVTKLKQENSTFAHIAYMDLLQNTQNKSEALRYAIDIANQYHSDVEIVERAAQLLWTFGDTAQAGELFYQACMLPTPSNEAFIRWDVSCWHSALFSKDDNLSIEQGVAASTRIVAESAVKDTEYLEGLQLHAELLVKAKHTTKAINAYQELLSLTKDKSTKRAAQKALKKLTKA